MASNTMVLSRSSVFILALPFLLSCCEASHNVGAGLAWTAPQPVVRSLEEPLDISSFIFTATELQRPMEGIVAGAEATTSSVGPSVKLDAASSLPDVEESDWETAFAAGVSESKNAIEAEDAGIASWASCQLSGAAVPARMLNAERLLQVAENAPADQWKAKTAERALRLYYHAKWLAERNYARAAEYRYRESAQLARSCRRSVLASHSLARLGYFLLHWKREAEAAEVLEESMKLNTKSNPLAPYLFGVLERKVAGGDIDRLKLAEDAILSSGEQPSEELEAERSRMIDEISFWREAEGSSRHCFASSDPAYMLICLLGHAAAFIRQALRV